jgi:Galactose-3-O-sulfotransferase
MRLQDERPCYRDYFQKITIMRMPSGWSRDCSDSPVSERYNAMIPTDTPHTIIFVHMFKSGGNTLNRIMDWEYNPLRIFSVNGRYCRWAYEKLTECPAAMLAGIQVFRGHMPFGLHKLLPQQSTYITLQRDPVERTISEYFSGVNRLIHRQHRIIKQLSLEEFLATVANNNSQTKMIAGLNSSYDFLSGECTAETLATAKANLRTYFTLVGITERFEETVALGKCKFGWRVSRYASFNATPGRSTTVSPQTRRLIGEYNSFDVELYRYAIVLFDQAVAQHGEQIANMREAVRRAQLTEGARLFYYRMGSTALKMFTLAASTARSMMPAGV